MKKVIGGAMYNTETAKRLAVWENMGDSRNFGYCSEDLYITKAGKYFIHGEGGPMSKYAEARGNNEWGYGSQITPVTPAAAAEWAEEHLTAEEYTELFGDPGEAAGDGREPLNLTVSADTKRKLVKMREETGKSMSAIIDEIVSQA